MISPAVPSRAPPSWPPCRSDWPAGPRWAWARAWAGRPAEIVAQEIQQRTAEQIFKVLGELKGGALKLGQALSIFEAALPPEIAGPYRATLTRLQDSAPPLPAATVHRVLAEDLGDELARPLRGVRRPAGGGRVDRPGAPGDLERRQAGGREDPVPGRGQGAEQRLHPAQPHRPAVRGADAGPGHEAAARGTAGPGGGRTGLPAGGAVAAQAFADAYAGDPDIYVPR